MQMNRQIGLTFAALQGRAADDHRGDGFQLPQQAGCRRGGAQARHVKHGGDTDADASYNFV